MTAIIVSLLGSAAEAYGKQLALTVGAGIVETLFHQGQIAADLDEIKRQLAALSDFIRNKLPALVVRATDVSLAHKAEFDVAEKARTIAGSIATLKRAINDKRPDVNIQFIVSELVGHSDAIFELGGSLIAYGQPHYASVGIAFGAGLSGYAAAAAVSPERIEGIKAVASNWKVRLQPWVDAKIPESFLAKLNWLQERYDLGAKTVPSFETWNTHTTREVAISWKGSTETGVWIHGAWFGYWKDKGLQGDTLAWFIQPGTSYEQAMAEHLVRPTTPTIPEWWQIKGDVPASMTDYNQCADALAMLIVDYYSYADLAPPLKGAVSLIEKTLTILDSILTSEAFFDTAKPLSEVDMMTAERKHQIIEDVLRRNLPGIGLTEVL